MPQQIILAKIKKSEYMHYSQKVRDTVVYMSDIPTWSEI